jgi:hypothetical protein
MMAAAGFDLLSSVEATALTPAERALPLVSLGLAVGDWIRLKAGRGFKTFELMAP